MALMVWYYLLSLLPSGFWWGVVAGALGLAIVQSSLEEWRRKREKRNQKSAG